MWNKLAFKPGETGSENGTILMDEEYKESCLSRGASSGLGTAESIVFANPAGRYYTHL